MHFDPVRPYQLNPRVRTIPAIHDCASVLARIAEAPSEGMLAADAAGELGTYVVDRDGATCWIAPGVQAIADLFDEPHSCLEVADLVCRTVGIPELDLAVFEDLVRAGVLIAPAAP